jgi:hypothetical protein
MVDCTLGKVSREEKARFIADNEQEFRRRKLESFGMSIPEGVGTYIDTSFQTWPAVFVRVKEGVEPQDSGSYLVVEGAQGATLLTDLKEHDSMEQTIRQWNHKMFEMKAAADKESTDITVKIPEALEDCDAVIRLPFVNDDMFNKVEFTDNSIVLSTCT